MRRFYSGVLHITRIVNGIEFEIWWYSKHANRSSLSSLWGLESLVGPNEAVGANQWVVRSRRNLPPEIEILQSSILHRTQVGLWEDLRLFLSSPQEQAEIDVMLKCARIWC